MGKAILFLLLLCSFTACKSKNGPPLTEQQRQAAIKDSANFTSLQWVGDTTRDLGTIERGDVEKMRYRFKNTGTKPLIINTVIPGCGCTVPEIPQRPILPGSEEEIVVKFYTKDMAMASHIKFVTVIANTLPRTEHYLSFKAKIIEGR